MKIRLYSDIHLDWYHVQEMWYPPEFPEDKETTLILAGDLGIGTNWISRLDTGTRSANTTFEVSWIQKVSEQFKQVLIVLGNHDYWPIKQCLTIQDGAKKCNEMLTERGITNVRVLDCDTYQDGDVLFIGATLWTDMGNRDELSMRMMNRLMSYDGEIVYNEGENGKFERFSSANWVQTHDKHRKYIEHVLSQNKDKKCVVITHHVPLEKLLDPVYNGQMTNVYYYSNLEKVLLDNDNLVMWCFGHTHFSQNVAFPTYSGEGAVRLVNNSVGYRNHHSNVTHEVLEV